MTQGEIVTSGMLVLPSVIIGAVTAVAARLIAHDRAIRARGRTDAGVDPDAGPATGPAR